MPQMRNPAGDSKGYAFVEFALPGAAAACKEAWNKAGEAQRQQVQSDVSGGGAEWARVAGRLLSLQRQQMGTPVTRQLLVSASWPSCMLAA